MITIQCESPDEAAAIRSLTESGVLPGALLCAYQVKLGSEMVGGASEPGCSAVLAGAIMRSGDSISLSTTHGDGVPYRTTWWLDEPSTPG